MKITIDLSKEYREWNQKRYLFSEYWEKITRGVEEGTTEITKTMCKACLYQINLLLSFAESAKKVSLFFKLKTKKEIKSLEELKRILLQNIREFEKEEFKNDDKKEETSDSWDMDFVSE